MKKWLWLTLLLILAGLGWVASGPYRTLKQIGRAVENADVAALERHVDFPAVRADLLKQMEARLAEEMRQRGAGDLLGQVGAAAVGRLAEQSVNAMVSPAGLMVLLQGRALQKSTGQAGEDQPPANVLENASMRFQSPSRFTASVTSASGQPVNFVLARQGLNWRLVAIELP